MTAQPPSLDPEMTVSAVALDIASNVFESLLTLDGECRPVPMLAESVEISEERLAYIFRLRKDVLFHDGQKMVAEDVAASMNRWLKMATRAKTLIAGASFAADGENAVRLALAEPASDTLLALAAHSQFPAVVPKRIADAAGEGAIAEFIGTGPYRFVEWKQDQYILLERFPDYKEIESPSSGLSGLKSAPTEKLAFHFVQDAQTRVSGLKAGTYDVADSLPTEDYEALSKDGSVKIFFKNSGAMTAFFNTRARLLENPVLRQAALAASGIRPCFSSAPATSTPSRPSGRRMRGRNCTTRKTTKKPGSF